MIQFYVWWYTEYICSCMSGGTQSIFVPVGEDNRNTMDNNGCPSVQDYGKVGLMTRKKLLCSRTPVRPFHLRTGIPGCDLGFPCQDGHWTRPYLREMSGRCWYAAESNTSEKPNQTEQKACTASSNLCAGMQRFAHSIMGDRAEVLHTNYVHLLLPTLCYNPALLLGASEFSLCHGRSTQLFSGTNSE